MYSLFIDTHDAKVSYALFKDHMILSTFEKESNMKHSEIAMPSLIEILSSNNISIKDINEIIVNIGPGSFTGVRIGVVIAKTLAYLLNIDIKIVNSIEMVAYSFDDFKPGVYAEAEKNGYFVSTINDAREFSDIVYYSKDEFNEKYDSSKVIFKTIYDFNNIYKHVLDKKPMNPHLVNPIYIKKIEVMK